MKKLITCYVASMILLSLCVFTLPVQAASIFENPKDINIVYIGGSITEGAGSNGKSNWVDIVGKYFCDTFGKENVTNHNVGIGGTGSDYGILRLQRDVIDKNPDMVFVEFTVNDMGKDTTRYLESIVLSLQKLEKVPYICFVHTTNATLQVSQENHSKVAEFYGLAQIDFQSRLKKELERTKKPISTYIGDGTHPTPEGYAVCGDEAVSRIKTGECYTKPVKQNKRLHSKSMSVNALFTPASSVMTRTGWQTVSDYITTVEDEGAVGSKLTHEFSGNVLAIEHRLHKNGGKYKVVIDGKTLATVSDFYRNNEGQLVLGYANFDLGQGKHTLEIEVVNQKDSASGGYMVGLYNIITNRGENDITKIDQNFDNGDISYISDTGATPAITWEWDGALGVDGTGAIKVTTATGLYGSSNGVAFNVAGLEKGRTYTLSASVKLDGMEKLLSDNVIFVFRLDGVDENGNLNGKNAIAKAVVEHAGLNNQEFVTVTTDFVFTGEGMLTSGKPVLCNNKGTFEVRVGDDNLSKVTGSKDIPLVYYIDNIKMIPGTKTGMETSQPEIQIIVDGVKVEADVPPVIVNDRTLVPVRAIFEALGATVTWDGTTRTVTAVRGADTVQLVIDSNILNKNGTEIEIDVPAKIMDDRTMVPARAVSESFGADVKWDGATRTVAITTK